MIAEDECPSCGDTHDGHDTVPIYTQDGPRRAHRSCMLREVMGGIGHHIDHEHFCVGQGDPDAGLGTRLSGLLVDTLIQHLGVDAVASKVNP